MRAQGRTLCCLELWSLGRGDDLRGDESTEVSVAKLFGHYSPSNIIGPDPFYKMQLLKDESKANTQGRPELLGTTRHHNPLLCSINAVSSMLLLRFGKDGIIGNLPPFFDPLHDWPSQNMFLTSSDGSGHLSYGLHKEIFASMKNAAGLNLLMGDSATKLRSFGAMSASENQASHPEIERAGRCLLPLYYPCLCYPFTSHTLATPLLTHTLATPSRWNGKKPGAGSDAHVLNQHYLRNLSTEVALANAGFNAKYWNMYLIPRARGTSMHDEHVKVLIEFFYPNLYEGVKRAKAAYEGNPLRGGDAMSETNYRFLSNLREITFFWLQDAVVLLQQIPELSSADPWRTLLKGAEEHEEIKTAFERLGTEVMTSISQSQVSQHEQLIAQEELLRSVEIGCTSTAHQLGERLSSLPHDVADLTEAAWQQRGETLGIEIQSMVVHGIRGVFRQMLVAGAGGISGLNQQQPEASRSGEGVAAEGSGGVAAGQIGGGVAAGGSGGQESARGVAAGGSGGEESGGGVAAGGSGGGVAAGGSGGEESGGGVAAGGSGGRVAAGGSGGGVAGGASRMANEVGNQSASPLPGEQGWTGRWHAPPASSVASTPLRRAPMPTSNTFVTGPREDGFYLGNDLHTVKAVWHTR
jgi:hypothetical protein